MKVQASSAEISASVVDIRTAAWVSTAEKIVMGETLKIFSKALLMPRF